MAFCGECGSEVRGTKFCGNCGAAVSVGSAAARIESPPVEHLTINVEEGGMAVGKSLVMNAMGSAAKNNCAFIATVSAPDGTFQIGRSPFDKAINIPVEHLSGLDRQNAEHALSLLHEQALSSGWKPIEAGPHWYTRRYERTYRAGREFTHDAPLPPRWGTAMGCLVSIIRLILGLAIVLFFFASFGGGSVGTVLFFIGAVIVPACFLFWALGRWRSNW